MKFIEADQLGFDPRPQMGRIFVEGFYHWLKHFCKDKDKLVRAAMHIFKLEHFVVALDGDKIAAMAACTPGKPPPIRLDKKILRQTFGFATGSFAYKMLQKHLVNHVYPFELSEGTGSIEFVAAAPEFRRQGVTYKLLEHVMLTEPYSEYVLEVADNNTAAIALYEKLGFREFKRVAGPSNSGIDFVYMRTERP